MIYNIPFIDKLHYQYDSEIIMKGGVFNIQLLIYLSKQI